jgi:hypothetical protein
MWLIVKEYSSQKSIIENPSDPKMFSLTILSPSFSEMAWKLYAYKVH